MPTDDYLGHSGSGKGASGPAAAKVSRTSAKAPRKSAGANNVTPGQAVYNPEQASSASDQGVSGSSGGGSSKARTVRWLFTGTLGISYDPVLRWETYNTVIPPKVSGEAVSFEQIDISDMAEQGYYRLTFRLQGPREFLQEMFFNGLGRHIAVYSPEGNTLWEGKLFEEDMYARGVEAVNSLKDEYNGVWMRYRITGSSTTVDSTAQDDAPSRARYGNRDYVLSAGELDTSGIADQIDLRVLALQRNPKPTLVPSGQSVQAEPYIDCTCIGYADTMQWQVYNQTSNTGSEAASVLMNDLLTAKAQYIASWLLQANATSTTRVFNVDRDMGDIAMDVGRLGDNTGARWLFRLEQSGRIAVYAPAAPPNLPSASFSGGGSPVFDNAVVAVTTSAALTVGNNQNRALVIFGGAGNANGNAVATATCSVGGSAATQIVNVRYSTWGNCYAWVFIAPAVGSNTATVSWTGLHSGQPADTIVLSYSNVNQSSPNELAATATISIGTTAISVAAASQIGETVCDFMQEDQNSTSETPGAGQIERTTPAGGAGSSLSCISSEKTAAAVSTTMSWSGITTAAQIALALKPAPMVNTPSIAYRIDIWDPDMTIRDAQGLPIAPWYVHSNTWIQITGITFPSIKETSSYIDDPTKFFVEKTEWKDGDDMPTLTNNRGQLLTVVISRIAATSSV